MTNNDDDEINIDQPNYMDSETLVTKVFPTQWYSSPDLVLEKLRDTFPRGFWEPLKRIEGKEARAEYT
ncbi:hypothetical protein [Actinopolyspora halophila]|uniref:hypothetical protein n=1 Tax=Actinopolyspora halophila TaxID=1850 RepID=UPI0012F90C64|nr:hypothetical protein [Actinopolyspora halophila]